MKTPNQWTLSQEEAGRLALEAAYILDTIPDRAAHAREMGAEEGYYKGWCDCCDEGRDEPKKSDSGKMVSAEYVPFEFILQHMFR
jgi:hypothetical protein